MVLASVRFGRADFGNCKHAFMKEGCSMKYEIAFNLSALAVDMLRGVSGADSAYDDAHKKQRGFFSALFDRLRSGRLDCVYWCSGRGNLYVLTRSAKDPDAIQNTCFWIRSGSLVPLSDMQYKTFADMRRDYLPDNVIIHTF